MSKRKEVMEKLNKAMKSVSVDKFNFIGTKTNLKMYDAFYEAKNSDDFHDWCEMVYENDYEEMLSEYEIDTHYIGRTSSFYFCSTYGVYNIYSIDDYSDNSVYKTSLENKRLMMFQEFMDYKFGIDIEFDSTDLDWDISEIVELSEIDWDMKYDLLEDESIEDIFGLVDFNELSQEFEDFCCDELDGINKAYMWLENFKDNQVEYFKDWLECQ